MIINHPNGFELRVFLSQQLSPVVSELVHILKVCCFLFSVYFYKTINIPISEYFPTIYSDVLMILVQVKYKCRWVIFCTAILIPLSPSSAKKPLYCSTKQKTWLLSFLYILIQIHFKSFNAPLEAGSNETNALKSWFSVGDGWSASSLPHKEPEWVLFFLSDLCCWMVYYHNERASKYSFNYSLKDSRAVPCGNVASVKVYLLDFILILTLNQPLLISISGVGSWLWVRRLRSPWSWPCMLGFGSVSEKKNSRNKVEVNIRTIYTHMYWRSANITNYYYYY